jgi:glycolate oxidase FAD binding subunit
LSVRVSAKPSAVSQITKSLQAIESDVLQAAVISQIGYGTVTASWYGDKDVPNESVAMLPGYARDVVHKAEGRMIVERCPTEAKSEFDVWGDIGAPLSTMRRMKDQYDPEGILNPGRFAGGI